VVVPSEHAVMATAVDNFNRRDRVIRSAGFG
jgi:hypothetical protein